MRLKNGEGFWGEGVPDQTGSDAGGCWEVFLSVGRLQSEAKKVISLERGEVSLRGEIGTRLDGEVT